MSGPLCARCGDRVPGPLAEQEERPLCSLCRRVEPPFERAVSFGAYDGVLRGLIHLYKYERVRPVANVLGRVLADVIACTELPYTLSVVPVPLYAAKARERGFNQSERIARAALKRLERPQWLYEPGLLRRVKPTASQTGLTGHQRRENVRGAFKCDAKLHGRSILLIDDVFTTGATAAECAKVLRRAGAAEVYVVTLARAMRPEPKFDTALTAVSASGQENQA